MRRITACWMVGGLLGAGLVPASGAAQEARGAEAAAAVKISDEAALEESLERAGDRKAVWLEALRECAAEQRPGLRHLLRHMPTRDLRELPVEQVLENVRLAYEARAAAPWTLPEDVFLDNVLPYANVSESRDPWRRELRERFLDAIAGCETPGEAAQKLNETIFPTLGVRYSTQRRRADQSPKESIEQGVASCTGLSILLTDACRAVGVPARLAGIASWVNKPGNHTWVEVWDDGWHFTGAAEPSKAGLNHTWFQGDAALAHKGSREHGIWAVSYSKTPHAFPMVWVRGGPRVWAVDVTERYVPAEKRAAASCRLMIEVRSARGERVALPVRVRSTSDSELVLQGRSKDEGADTNDLLTFELPHGARYEVVVGDQVQEVEIGQEAQKLLRIREPGAGRD